MQTSLHGLDLSTLPLDTLQAMEESVDAFIFSQQLKGEKFHPSYRRNKKLFKKLLRETTSLKRAMSKFFASQFERLRYPLRLPMIQADELPEAEAYYLSQIDWDKEDQTLTATLEINLGTLFQVGAQAAEMKLQTDLNIGPTQTEEAKFLRQYTVDLAGEINDTTKKRITQQIKTSIEVGESREQLTERINQVLNNPNRARMIAQTESIRAFAEGTLAVGRRLGIPYKQWEAFQTDPSEICGRLNGKVVPLEEAFEGGVFAPAAHPSCRCSLKLLYVNPNQPDDQVDIPDLSADKSIFDSAR